MATNACENNNNNNNLVVWRKPRPLPQVLLRRHNTSNTTEYLFSLLATLGLLCMYPEIGADYFSETRIPCSLHFFFFFYPPADGEK